MIRKHIYISDDIDTKIKNYADLKHLSFSDAVVKLINQGLSNDIMIGYLKELSFNQKYLIKLHEQAYTDLGVEFFASPEANKRLKNFKNNLNKDKMDD